MVETVERLLRAPSQMGLYTRAQCLEYLGSMFRGTLDVPARFTDLQVRGKLACFLGNHWRVLTLQPLLRSRPGALKTCTSP